MKKIIIISAILLNSLAAIAQQVSAGAAFMTYKGDLNPSRSNNPFSWKPAYSFALEKRILNEKADVSLGIVSGNIMYVEQNININRNFKTNILQPEISFRYILANEKLNARPYLGAGVAYALYKTYYDLADENSNLYFYWSDGSIRDREELPGNTAEAKTLYQDYKYETFSGNEGGALLFPLTAGALLRTGNKTEINMYFRYCLSTTDQLDSYVITSKKDRLYLVGASFIFRFDKKSYLYEENKNYRNVNHKALSSEDADKDGVIDFDDACPNTSNGVKVDAKGCPVDSDADRVPDYLDEEPNTTQGIKVDAKGRTLNEDVILIKNLLYNDKYSDAVAHYKKVEGTLSESYKKELKSLLNLDR
ncbi:MAG: hypothetical protein HND27_01570 [Bacteroidetes bacterium]|nr:hypothetical protein [Flavobacteriales bacterium]NOG94446.1 hypothetical protein [Bacteroidota bacterium]WKZ74262.1 MAG: hypothetical protein QY303_08905 [Vicingaceae bacterium]GIK70978.1 MAG: hypothetical protein BroJett020_22730 [Bacteroidota bacterium]CAG0978740.1 Alpha-agarase [Flavobacteriales bacterium]